MTTAGLDHAHVAKVVISAARQPRAALGALLAAAAKLLEAASGVDTDRRPAQTLAAVLPIGAVTVVYAGHRTRCVIDAGRLFKGSTTQLTLQAVTVDDAVELGVDVAAVCGG